jgi:hypothetical protein
MPRERTRRPAISTRRALSARSLRSRHSESSQGFGARRIAPASRVGVVFGKRRGRLLLIATLGLCWWLLRMCVAKKIDPPQKTGRILTGKAFSPLRGRPPLDNTNRARSATACVSCAACLGSRSVGLGRPCGGRTRMWRRRAAPRRSRARGYGVWTSLYTARSPHSCLCHFDRWLVLLRHSRHHSGGHLERSPACLRHLLTDLECRDRIATSASSVVLVRGLLCLHFVAEAVEVAMLLLTPPAHTVEHARAHAHVA